MHLFPTVESVVIQSDLHEYFLILLILFDTFDTVKRAGTRWKMMKEEALVMPPGITETKHLLDI